MKPVRSSLGVALLFAPLYALYGIWMLLRLPLLLLRRAEQAKAALATDLFCAAGHANSSSGRFKCASCSAVYYGWVGECPVCGAGAGYLPCSRCGLAIPLPWER